MTVLSCPSRMPVCWLLARNLGHCYDFVSWKKRMWDCGLFFATRCANRYRWTAQLWKRIGPTSCSRVLLVKLIVAQLVKKSPAVYWNGRFITVFTRVHHRALSQARWILSTHRTHFYIILWSRPTFPEWSLSFTFSDKFCAHFLCSRAWNMSLQSRLPRFDDCDKYPRICLKKTLTTWIKEQFRAKFLPHKVIRSTVASV
jgi:hypothetical protein